MLPRLFLALLLTVSCSSKRLTPAPKPAPHAPTPVPADYTTATERTLAEGRAALALFVDDKLLDLHARMSPELAKLATAEMLGGLRGQLVAAGALHREDDTVFLVAGARAYVADVKAGERILGVTMAFDDKGTLVSLNFVPRAELPPDPHAARANQMPLRLPFEGQWWVVWGGERQRDNYHVVAPDQRHAYDFVIWKEGGTYRGDGKKNEDYYCWGQPVVAPAAATVVTAFDGAPDNAPGVMDPANKAGNHVVLDFGNGEYALLGHLQNGSLSVKAGEQVKVGQRLGLTGNSGNTSEPHLHFHLQDRPVLFEGAGIPVRFEGVCADGEAPTQSSPVHGQFVEDCG